ncbi:MAG: hypothetical protein ETSY1_40380 [Candidatus Entotheonella factor]|uniref:MucR family transcriptional regulator n=1 Tax=Entotheonella factor TaxID=1429438 RepID=W4L5L0_ENTF1|nr:MucR family transcriptional regulator [Candidatus Entotheonella palauensis]ETW93174.1 MAG: hypothetical protein ETSY1_40380 [Candidatus Entotheonella factor]
MSQTLLEMAKELVTELIHVHQLAPSDAASLLHRTHETLLRLQQDETAKPEVLEGQPTRAVSMSWKSSIGKRTVTCLECGAKFRQLSLRHLRKHNLDPRSYRIKYGIPSSQSLSAREATARRRELAQQVRPWELARAKRLGTNKPA